MFTLLLTVILGLCIGAVAADLLLGPEQPATPTAGSNRERWDPWLRWLTTGRIVTRRGVQWLGRRLAVAARATGHAGAWLLQLAVVAPLQSARESWSALRGRRVALRQRQAAHARYVAHIEELEALGLPYQIPAPPRRRRLRPDVPAMWRRAPTSPPDETPAPVPPPAEWPVPVPPGEPADVTAQSDIYTAVTTELAPTDTLELPGAPVPTGARPRPSGPWTGLTSRTPTEVLPRVERVEPGEPGVQVPLSVPMESRLRALAILSVVVCVFGVATASVLLLIIVTLSRAVGGI